MPGPSLIHLVSSPWRWSRQDLHDAMVLLGDRTQWDQLGSRRFLLIMRLHQAAVNKSMNIPYEFFMQVKSLADDPDLSKPGTERFQSPKITQRGG